MRGGGWATGWPHSTRAARCAFICTCPSARASAGSVTLTRSSSGATARITSPAMPACSSEEMGLWAAEGGLDRRPVSTVHFGGGTPVFLGVQAFGRLVETCAATFAVDAATEWALESTVRDLTPEIVGLLHGLGFRRLHIGVQTLEDPVRSEIGRRSPAAAVLRKIEEMLALGWVVSVDLICGLPQQTPAGFLAGLAALVDLGVDGFSLYELLDLPAEPALGRGTRADQPLAPAELPHVAGGRATTWRRGDFARTCSTTGPTRATRTSTSPFPAGTKTCWQWEPSRMGCSATITTATGVMPRTGARRRPGIRVSRAGWLAAGQRIRCGRLSSPSCPAGCLLGTLAGLRRTLGAHAGPLLEQWQSCGLLAEGAEPGELALTSAGSWFAGNMLLQLEDALRKTR